MTNKAIKKKTYTVSVNITGSFMMEVCADTLEEAIEIARAHNSRDLLNAVTEWNDHETEITGVFC
jgi:hypothetical protein